MPSAKCRANQEHDHARKHDVATDLYDNVNVVDRAVGVLLLMQSWQKIKDRTKGKRLAHVKEQTKNGQQRHSRMTLPTDDGDDDSYQSD